MTVGISYQVITSLAHQPQRSPESGEGLVVLHVKKAGIFQPLQRHQVLRPVAVKNLPLVVLQQAWLQAAVGYALHADESQDLDRQRERNKEIRDQTKTVARMVKLNGCCWTDSVKGGFFIMYCTAFIVGRENEKENLWWKIV